MGTLYVVGTPIGNLEDITLRALRVLREVGLIAAEDTRRTRKLLARYDIHTPLTSYFEHNKLTKLDTILAALREKDVALVSEAGMPGLSDPGYELIRAAIEAGVPVVPVPGPSAPITALVVSGLPTDSFTFLGFLPRRAQERRQLLQSVVNEPRTLVAFEAPHRLLKALEDIVAILGDRPLAVVREVTKLHEEVWRGTAREAIAWFTEHPPRGEFTLVIGGATEPEPWDEARVRAEIERLLAEGVSHREAVKIVAEASGWPRREVYRLALNHPPAGLEPAGG
ncbi:MAG: 16S rRNA (cytidine(1402)-2'-O)-methyltransferase [Anaerolineae bacterium]|nr:16S rRNA (cytidine(1402)-2'-O)-methyltransferase [Anaerolineae bacterium]